MFDINWGRLMFKLMVIIFIWILPITAALIDLRAATREAKKVGQPVMSDGLKRTINKVTGYYQMMSFALIGDMLFSVLWIYYDLIIFELPFFTVLTAFLTIWTEFRSVKEHQSEGFKKQIRKSSEDVMKAVQVILQNKTNIKEVVDFLEENSRKDENDNNDIN